MKAIYLLFVSWVVFHFYNNTQTELEFQVQTNEFFTTGLQNEIIIENDLDLFSAVFKTLPSKVIVRPSENYYYWDLFVNGTHYKGNIGLFADLRKKGKINFGYYEEVFDVKSINQALGGMDIAAADGINLIERDLNTYDLTFENKTVTFLLNPSIPAVDAKLAIGEKLIGSTYDESGIAFNLIYDSTFQHIFWTLNDRDSNGEQLSEIRNGLMVGNRTGFVYYLDSLNHRKVLCGVYGPNIQKNTWYDGPFDQLPDNQIYAGQLNLSDYMIAAYPDLENEIDIYGHFLNDPESRVALANYMTYFKIDMLAHAVKYCQDVATNHQEFIYYLTQDRYPRDLFEEKK